MSSKDVSEMTVDELKSKLEELGLPLSGSKAILREKLRGATEDDNVESDDEVDNDLNGAQIDAMPKAELVERLRGLSLKVTGKKADLCIRFKSDLAIQSEELSNEGDEDSNDEQNSDAAGTDSDNRSEQADEDVRVAPRNER